MGPIKRLSARHVAISGYLLMITGLLASRFLISTGIILLLLSALLQPGIKGNVRKIFSIPPVIASALFFIFVMISGIYSTDLDYFADRLRIKLPFLLIPFAILAVPLTRKLFQSILYFFVVVTVIGCLWSMARLIGDYASIVDSYQYAKVLPTAVNHVRFSLMIALAIIAGFSLYHDRFYLLWKGERYCILVASVLLFLFLHFLAVRSGLLAFYLAVALLLTRHVFLSRRYWIGGVFMVAMLVIPYVGYHLVPTFRNKVNYTRYDLKMYLQGNVGQQYSDSRRIYSIRSGIQVGNSSPIVGVGYGDIKKACYDVYSQIAPGTPDENRIGPHNQFVFVYAGLGLLGLTLFLLAIISPIFYQKSYQDTIVLSISVIIISSFFTEHTVEGQIGTAFYLLFLWAGINNHGNRSTDE